MHRHHYFFLTLTLLAIGVIALAACSGATPTPLPATSEPATLVPTTAATSEATEAAEEVARPSNEGGPGPALDLTGDATAGEQVYKTSCAACHGEQGKGGVANAGSDDGVVPELNPIDPTIANADPKTFAYNLDLFIEHGSKPEGDNPALTMPAFGDDKTLTAQQIADVIAYLIGLNPTK